MSSRPKNVLSGLARCPLCDSSMLRVSKRHVSKRHGERHHMYLVCSKAKLGAGCEYVGVPYAGIEAALFKDVDHLVHAMPSVDKHLAQGLRQANVNLDALDDRRVELAKLLERHPSETVAKRLAHIEADLKTATAARDELASRAAATETKSLKLRCENLKKAVKASPRDLTRVNTALKELLTGVVVDHTTGHLELRWRAGGTSSTVYAFPKSAKRRIGTS